VLAPQKKLASSTRKQAKKPKKRKKDTRADSVARRVPSFSEVLVASPALPESSVVRARS